MNCAILTSQPAQPVASLAQPPWNWLCQATGGAPLGGSAEGASGGG